MITMIKINYKILSERMGVGQASACTIWNTIRRKIAATGEEGATSVNTRQRTSKKRARTAGDDDGNASKKEKGGNERFLTFLDTPGKKMLEDTHGEKPGENDEAHSVDETDQDGPVMKVEGAETQGEGEYEGGTVEVW